jgi:hypothetical protein
MSYDFLQDAIYTDKPSRASDFLTVVTCIAIIGICLYIVFTHLP